MWRAIGKKDLGEGGGGELGASELASLRAISKRRNLSAISSVVKTTKDVSSVLEDPKLPSQPDLARWWPEPPSGVPNPLRPYRPSDRSPGRDRGPPPSGNEQAWGGERFPEIGPTGSTATTATTVLPTLSGATGGTVVTALAQLPRTPGSNMKPSGSNSSLPRSSSMPSRGNSKVWRKQKTSSRDPSRTMGAPEEITLPVTVDAVDAFARIGSAEPLSRPATQHLHMSQQLEALDRSTRLSHWLVAFEADEEAFASKAVFVEMRLRQALSSSVALGVPNTFRTAVVCDAFERVAPMTGRYEGVLVLIWRELLITS